MKPGAKRLVDLSPRWFRSGGEGVTETATGKPVPERNGVGLSFECPCGCSQRCAIHIDPPMDGKGPLDRHGQNVWTRTGDSFENLTLRPSIQRVGGCKWHGFITDGVAEPC